MSATVLIPNITAMVLLLVLLFSSTRVTRRAVLLDTRIFALMAGCNFFQCAGEIFTYAIDGVMLPGFRPLILVSNAMLFIFNICFAYLWVVYADYKIYESVERIKKRARVLAIPAVLVIIGSVLNLFTPLFFEISESNQYHRAALYFIPYAITYFYLLYGTVFIYRHKSQAKKYVFIPAAIFMVPIIIGSIVQLIFYGLSTVWVGVAIALVAVYVNVQNETSYIDALSGVYTRIYLHHYLEVEISKTAPSKKIAGIMLDVDKFKMINDELGHLVGDDAIRSVGKILLNALPSECIAARYGGDEFVVLQEIESSDEVNNTMQVIEQAVDDFNRTKGKPYTLHFSMGWSMIDPENDTIDTFLGRLDRKMYETKALGRAQE